jgi:hypothetical protein
VPRLGRWRPPELPFSWKASVRREFTTAFVIVMWFVIIDYLADGLALGNWRFGLFRALTVGLGGVVYLVLVGMARATSLLEVEGR